MIFMEMFMKSFIIMNMMVMMFIIFKILIDLDPFLMISVIFMILILFPKILFVSIFNFQPLIPIILDVAKTGNKAQKGVLRNSDSSWDALGSGGLWSL